MKIVITTKHGVYETENADLNEDEKQDIISAVEKIVKGEYEYFGVENAGKHHHFSKQLLLDSIITVVE